MLMPRCKIKQLKEYLKCDIEILSETWGECNHLRIQQLY